MSEIGGFQPVVYTEVCRTGSSDAKSSAMAMAETKLLFKTTELPEESKAGITENRGEESNNSKTDELLKEIVGMMLFFLFTLFSLFSFSTLLTLLWFR